MHMGGAFANFVVRAEEPSALGHGVSPLIDAPAAGMVTSTGPEDGAVVEPPDAATLVFLSEPVKNASANRTATTATRMMPKFRTLRSRFDRCWAVTAASIRACRPSFCRSRLAVPMG